MYIVDYRTLKQRGPGCYVVLCCVVVARVLLQAKDEKKGSDLSPAVKAMLIKSMMRYLVMKGERAAGCSGSLWFEPMGIDSKSCR